MATFSRSTTVNWQGTIMEGKGEAVAGTGAFTLPVTFASRIGEPAGKTSPEELIAAAHASCYAMAFSGGLGRAGHAPTKLEVTATVTFDKIEAGWRVISSALEVRGTVPGIDDAAFQKAAEAAKDGCPISQALKGNVALSVKATLA